MARSKEEVQKEIESLEDLTRSEGWGVFTQRLLDEWQNQGYVAQMNNALKAPDALIEVKALHRTAVNIVALIDWPKTRIEYLRGLK